MFRFYITDLFEGRVIGTNDMGEAYNPLPVGVYRGTWVPMTPEQVDSM